MHHPELVFLRFNLARDEGGNATNGQLLRRSSEVDSGSETAE